LGNQKNGEENEAYANVGQLHHARVVAAGGFEDGEQMSDAEKVADGRAHVYELECDVGFAGGDVKADEYAEAGAVHSSERGEIEGDAFFARQQFLHLRFEKRCAFGDESAAAVQGQRVVMLLGANG
jgi:hypothetical protein